MPLACAAGRTTSIAVVITATRSTGCTSSLSLPLMIRAVSSRSSINCSWILPFRSMIPTRCLICATFAVSARSSRA